MKIKYQFATETVEIEVDEEWGNVIIDLNRREYNNNHAETRRHTSLEEFNIDGTLLPSDSDVLEDVIASEEHQKLYDAISQLSERQRHLIEEVYFKHRSYADIAREEGLNRATVQRATVVAVGKLKKLLGYDQNDL